MPQPNDLSRSLVTLDQNSTIIAVVELSQSSWLVGGVVPGIERQPHKKLEPSPERLLAVLHRWRDEAVRAGGTITRIALAFEAGRDGFWLARSLESGGVEAAAAAVLYRFVDASMLPLVSENLGRGRERHAALVMAAIIVAPQIIVAVAAPWVGHYAEQWGRKPVLLIGFGLEPLRGVLFALSASWYSTIAVQILDGITGAIITVMTVLIMTDLTAGTGRFNLAQGAVGTCTGVAAAVSTTATGVIATGFGRPASFLTTAAVAALAVLLLWLYLPESRPKEYLD